MITRLQIKSLFLLVAALSSFSVRGQQMVMQHDTEKHYPFHTKIGKCDIYHLYLADTVVNFNGKQRPAMAINGSLPAPALEFTEGDTAEIYVHNEMMMETSVHWHGLILPNRYDGVSYLTTAPIGPGQTHKYKFPLVQHGTCWYHSHTMTQQQSGLYGAFIIHPKQRSPEKEYTLVLSDWTDENPEQVERSLHNQTDWYAIRKHSTQNYSEAIATGYFKIKLANEWKRMAAMDVSDIYYDRFLSNGKATENAPQFKKGDRVKLRVINGGSSTYFWLQFAGGKITVAANDGEDVQAVTVDRLIIAPAETYDLIVTIPDDGSFEFLSTAEDRSKSTSLWMGKGPKVTVKPLPRLKYFEGMKMMNGMMAMDGSLEKMEGMAMANQEMDMNTPMYPEISGTEDESYSTIRRNAGSALIVTLNYGMLKAPKPTNLPAGALKTFYFNLTGNMNRYIWTINNKTVSESDKILIKRGENVRIILYNNTMMRHPMHLHGHYFRLLNGQGDYSPLKNTLDIMPMETDTIEFAATASGDWFFHCHILYHMMSGMGRIFSYENSPLNPDVPDPVSALQKVYADDRRFYPMAKISLESNGSDGGLSFANTRWKLSTQWHLGLSSTKGYESETMFGRYFGEMQWLYGYTGFDYHYKRGEQENNIFGQRSDKNDRHTAVVGLSYTLPMLFVADARIDGNGKVRFQLGREDIPLTSRLRCSMLANTDKEYSIGLRYIVTKLFSLSGHYDSDMGPGGGLTVTY